MQIDGLSVSLSPREVVSLICSLPLPKGISVSEVTLTEKGIEAIVKASLLLGLPVKFQVAVENIRGSKVFLRVNPPMKPNWLLLKPTMLAIPGARYAGNSLVEVDLVSLSKGFLTGVSLKKLYLGKNGLAAEVASVSSTYSWVQLLDKIKI